MSPRSPFIRPWKTSFGNRQESFSQGPQRVDGKPANLEGGDLDVTTGWGHAGKGGVTMPGKGKLSQNANETYDVFPNDVACWRNIPEAVWGYTIGGYQVIKKWPSYREIDLLGRSLTPDEVRYVTEMARRLAALISLQPKLDEIYRDTIAATYTWPKKEIEKKEKASI